MKGRVKKFATMVTVKNKTNLLRRVAGPALSVGWVELGWRVCLGRSVPSSIRAHRHTDIHTLWSVVGTARPGCPVAVQRNRPEAVNNVRATPVWLWPTMFVREGGGSVSTFLLFYYSCCQSIIIIIILQIDTIDQIMWRWSRYAGIIAEDEEKVRYNIIPLGSFLYYYNCMEWYDW